MMQIGHKRALQLTPSPVNLPQDDDTPISSWMTIIHGFDPSFYICIDLWLTLESNTDVQQPLQDVDQANPKELDFSFSLHGFDHTRDIISVTALAPGTISPNLSPLSTSWKQKNEGECGKMVAQSDPLRGRTTSTCWDHSLSSPTQLDLRPFPSRMTYFSCHAKSSY